MYRLAHAISVSLLMLTVSPAWSQLPSGALLIDNRTPAEYQSGHAEGAALIPYDGIEAGILKLTEDKDTPIYLYCGSGGRSEIARQRLLQRGYTQVTNLGGLDDARAFLAGEEEN